MQREKGLEMTSDEPLPPFFFRRLTIGGYMGILSLIASRNFIAVNKTLIRELGLECAVLLGELASESEFFSDDKQDGFFYATVEKIKDNTGISDYQQRKAIEKLCSLGILESRLMGCPAKRYFKISCENTNVKSICMNYFLFYIFCHTFHPPIILTSQFIILTSYPVEFDGFKLSYRRFFSRIF